MAYESQHKLRDGAVLVYVRSQGKKNIYQVRIRVPDTPHYIVRSLKTEMVPSQKTIDMEAGMLRQIFRWGKRMGFVKREPWVKSIKVKHEKGVTRRPSFTLEEWRTIYTYLRTWVSEKITVSPNKAGGSLHRSGPHSLHRFQREMLRNYILFMANIHQQALDTTTASGRMIFGIFSALGEYERELMRERIMAGQRRARSQGVKIGRPSKMNEAVMRSG